MIIIKEFSNNDINHIVLKHIGNMYKLVIETVNWEACELVLKADGVWEFTFRIPD